MDAISLKVLQQRDGGLLNVKRLSVGDPSSPRNICCCCADQKETKSLSGICVVEGAVEAVWSSSLTNC